VPAVVIGTKAGQIYVLDRATGKPLTEVEEVPVKPPTSPTSPTRQPSRNRWACRRSARRP
jgi:quinate dehydrogenase (quinone)